MGAKLVVGATSSTVVAPLGRRPDPSSTSITILGNGDNSPSGVVDGSTKQDGRVTTTHSLSNETDQQAGKRLLGTEVVNDIEKSREGESEKQGSKERGDQSAEKEPVEGLRSQAKRFWVDVLEQQGSLFCRGFLVCVLCIIPVLIISPIQTEFEYAITGSSSYFMVRSVMKEEKINTTRLNYANQYAQSMKGVEVIFFSNLLGLLYYLSCGITTVVVAGRCSYRNFWEASIVFTLGSGGLGFITYFLFDGEPILWPYIITYFGLWIPHLWRVTLKKGCAKWPWRVLKRLVNPTVTYISVSCSIFYYLVTRVTEPHLLLNIFIMGVGFPMLQFCVRWFIETTVNGVYTTVKQEDYHICGPIILFTEIYLTTPGFVVQLLTPEESAFYATLTISLIIEALQIIPFIKARRDRSKRASLKYKSHALANGDVLKYFRISDNALSQYVAHQEQGEKIAVMTSIFFVLALRGFSLSFLIRALVMLLLEVVVDIAKVRICDKMFKLQVSKQHIAWNRPCVSLYMIGSLVSIVNIFTGIIFDQYLLYLTGSEW